MQINIKVISRAHKNIVEKQDDNNFVVRTTAVPDDNKANKAVQKLLADYFGVAKSRICIVRGTKSKNKIIEINTSL